MEKALVVKNDLLNALELEVRNHATSFLANQRSRLTAIEYKKDLNGFVEFLQKHCPNVKELSQLKKSDIIIYKTFLEMKGYAASTIGRRLTAVSEFLKYLATDGVVEKDLFYGIKYPKVINKRETIAFTDLEVVSILASIDTTELYGKFHHAILSMAFGTALRSSELRFLKKGDIAQINGFKVIRVKTKGSKVLELPLHNYVVESVDRYLKNLESRGVVLTDSDFLFQSPPNRRGHKAMPIKSLKPIHHSTLDSILKKYAGKLAIKTGAVYRVSPHSIRATVATSLRRNGEELESVQRLLNHANISTTQRYDKSTREIKDSASLKVKYFDRKS